MLIFRKLMLCCSLLVVLGDLQAQEAQNAMPAGQSGEADVQLSQSLAFDIWEYRVKGNTLLDTTKVERTVYSFLGPDKTVDDIDAASVALATLYKESGYPTVIVDIPEQDVSSGVVTLEVIEGSVDRLRITGSRYFSLEKIKQEVPALAEGEVPYLPDVQDQLQALNAGNADRQVTPIFRAGRDPGTVEVELRVKDELPFHASLELNGRNSADTTRPRLVADLRYDNLWQRSHSMSLMFQVSPEDIDEVRVLSATYVLPVGSASDRLAFYAIRSESDSEVASAGALSVIGNGTIVGARWVKPLDGSSDYFHNLTFGADYKDFDESTELVGADTLETPIDYTKFSTDYSGTLLGESTLSSFSLGFNFAPRGLGNNEQEFDEKRFQARPNFSYLTGKLNQEYRLSSGIRLRGGLQAQLAGEPLISNEQFSVGGAESVRGYHESELLGDDGLQASIEVLTPSYAWLENWGFNNIHALAFVDGGLVKLHDTLPGTDEQQEIYGVGLGVRLSGPWQFKAVLDLAWAMKDTTSIDAGDPRLHFLVRSGF